ncbi:kinase-like domain-containing protein [Dendryphion nanum]|uniref:Kinase-like domain-containing protein n=1 Tax=Dendryphion nanum TaxID=256645 RepID=A0A9P9IEG4_9PLEO|nr:kinase-like domain-containing protein [Dendryphion nanum]
MSLTYTDFVRDYLIERELGRGGDGVVQEYKHTTNGSLIAVKTSIRRDRRSLDGIITEINMMRKIGSSPFIVKMLGYDERVYQDFVQHGPYIFYEHMDLGDAWDYHRKLFQRLTYVPEETVWKFFSDVLQGLNHLHNLESGPLMHGDLKPSNILVRRQAGDNSSYPTVPVFKLADFGRTAAYDPDGHPHRYYGTYEYAPPVAERNNSSPAGDMWSLGASIQSIALTILPIQDLQEFRDDWIRKGFAAPSLGQIHRGQEWRKEIPVVWRPLDKPFKDRKVVYSSALDRWYTICLNEDPKTRMPAEQLVRWLVPVAEHQIRVLEARRNLERIQRANARVEMAEEDAERLRITVEVDIDEEF